MAKLKSQGLIVANWMSSSAFLFWFDRPSSICLPINYAYFILLGALELLYTESPSLKMISC
jgi:hypothetical protein